MHLYGRVWLLENVLHGVHDFEISYTNQSKILPSHGSGPRINYPLYLHQTQH